MGFRQHYYPRISKINALVSCFYVPIPANTDLNKGNSNSFATCNSHRHIGYRFLYNCTMKTKKNIQSAEATTPKNGTINKHSECCGVKYSRRLNLYSPLRLLTAQLTKSYKKITKYSQSCHNHIRFYLRMRPTLTKYPSPTQSTKTHAKMSCVASNKWNVRETGPQTSMELRYTAPLFHS